MTAGESHGKALIAVIDGIPAGLEIDKEFIDTELSRRMTGYGRGKRMSIEKDKVDILSGCRKGITIGSPVCLMIPNVDHKIDDLADVINPRPGHADLAGVQKYGFQDARDVLERASARETAARVAAGSVAKIFLKEFGIRIISHVTAIGGVTAALKKYSFDELLVMTEGSDLRCADREAEKAMKEEIDKAAKNGDTLGGVFRVVVNGVPPGLGSHVQWDRKLDGIIAQAVMSIQAVKAVSIGEGIENAARSGSEVHDSIYYNNGERAYYRLTNNAGGIEGGITNGEDIIVHGFMKPIATLTSPLKSVNINTKEDAFASTERSDVTAVAACGVVAEAMLAVTIAAAFVEKFGNDSVKEIKRNFEAYINELKKR